MDKLLINLSMIGKRSTGLGVFSLHVTKQLNSKFRSEVITSAHKTNDIATKFIQSPENITFGFSKYASVKRLFYLNFKFPSKNGFLYTPTQHGVIGEKNQVITIHDLIPTHFPETRRMEYMYYKYIIPRIIKSCHAVFTVSNVAKKDICRYYHVSEDFVYVIPNGVNMEKYQCKREPYIGMPFLLIVGAANIYKNTHIFLENNIFWKDKYKLKIVSAKGSYKDYLEKLIKEYGLEDKVEFLGYVEDHILTDLYRNCKALVYPSQYEGFGIPPLEALAAGKPAIVSDIPIFKETLGEAGIFVNINDCNSWENALNALDNEDYIQQRVAIGKEIVDKYTWANSGRILTEALLDVEPKLKEALLK